jgi:hypothetical protein
VVKKAQNYSRDGNDVIVYVTADRIYEDLFGPNTTFYLIGQELDMLDNILSLLADDKTVELSCTDKMHNSSICIVDILRWAVSAIIKMNDEYRD